MRFLCNSAWRSGEAQELEWDKVDLGDWIVRLSRNNEKTKHPRTLALVGEIREVIENRIKVRRLEMKYDGILPHDMRRSAIRNFRKAGVSESDGMKISGHKTNSVYKRYEIIDEEDQRRTIEKVQEHQRRELENLKVVPVKRAG